MQITFNQCDVAVDVPDDIEAVARAAASPMMDASELLYLAATILCADYPPGAIVVEIGAFRGQTTVFIAQVLKRLGLPRPVLSVDPFERVNPDPLNPQGSYSAYMETLRASGVDDVCAPLVAFSENAAPLVPDNVGMLVIDGCHHYEVVIRDLELYCPKVGANGMVFIDDYTEHYSGVVRAVDEYFGSGGAFRILHRSYFVIARREAVEFGTVGNGGPGTCPTP